MRGVSGGRAIRHACEACWSADMDAETFWGLAAFGALWGLALVAANWETKRHD